MTNQCGACTATTHDATLCSGCGDQLRDVLKALPGLIDDLATSATKQARLTASHEPPVKVEAEDRQADHDEQAIPAALRSRMGRVTLVATPLPVAFGPLTLHRQAVAGVTSWATAAGFTFASVHGTCSAIARDLGRIRKLDTAPEIHARALDLKATIEAAVDRRPADVFAYMCEASILRHDEDTDTLTPAPCEHALYAAPGAETVECPRCGAEWDVAERRAVMLDLAGERISTVGEAARVLRGFALDVTVHKIDGWLRRKQITDYGTSARGRLVKIGEVRAYSEMLAEKSAARRT